MQPPKLPEPRIIRFASRRNAPAEAEARGLLPKLGLKSKAPPAVEAPPPPAPPPPAPATVAAPPPNLVPPPPPPVPPSAPVAEAPALAVPPMVAAPPPPNLVPPPLPRAPRLTLPPAAPPQMARPAKATPSPVPPPAQPTPPPAEPEETARFVPPTQAKPEPAFLSLRPARPAVEPEESTRPIPPVPAGPESALPPPQPAVPMAGSGEAPAADRPPEARPGPPLRPAGAAAGPAPTRSVPGPVQPARPVTAPEAPPAPSVAPVIPLKPALPSGPAPIAAEEATQRMPRLATPAQDAPRLPGPIQPPAGAATRDEDPLTSTRRPVRLGLATLIVTFLGFGGWASLAPLGSAVVAPGNLVVESNRQDVQHLDGGQTARLLVREGDRVAAGDVLITLDPVRVNAQAALVRSQLDAARLLVARLRAEQGSLAELPVPEDLQERARREPQLAAAIQAQRSIMETRRVSFEGQVSVLNQRIRQLREQIGGLVAQERSRVQQVRLLRQELDGVIELLRGGHATRIRALGLERDIARLEGERGEHAANVSRLEQSIGEAELQILQLHRNFDEDVAARLQEGQQAVAEAQERLTSAEDQARRLDIRAPVSGTVVGLAVHTVGAVIAPGQLLMQIVPGEDRLLVEAEIRVEDVERLSPGVEAVIQFPGLPQVSMPLVTGRLLVISADRLTDPRTGQPHFRARLAVDEESRAKLADRRIVPGMPVQVMIRTGQRTMLGYLLDPVTLALGRAMQER
jgi:HlyD family type I secretion membrane fusion protein